MLLFGLKGSQEGVSTVPSLHGFQTEKNGKTIHEKYIFYYKWKHFLNTF